MLQISEQNKIDQSENGYYRDMAACGADLLFTIQVVTRVGEPRAAWVACGTSGFGVSIVNFDSSYYSTAAVPSQPNIFYRNKARSPSA